MAYCFTEHVVSIIASMLRNCQGSQRQRLLAKFTENDLEKVDRLLELHFKYMDKVDRTEKEMEVRIFISAIEIIIFSYGSISDPFHLLCICSKKQKNSMTTRNI